MLKLLLLFPKVFAKFFIGSKIIRKGVFKIKKRRVLEINTSRLIHIYFWPIFLNVVVFHYSTVPQSKQKDCNYFKVSKYGSTNFFENSFNPFQYVS